MADDELKQFMSDKFEDLSTQIRGIRSDMKERFDTLNVRMDGMDARFRAIETRLDNLPCNRGEGCGGCK